MVYCYRSDKLSVTVMIILHVCMHKINAVPPLMELSITSSPPSPIRPIGTGVIVNCSCDIGQSLPTRVLDIDIIVSISLRDPFGRLLATTIPLVNGSMYTSSAVISTFGRDQSGFYTCTASVRASSSFIVGIDTSKRTRVTTGKIIL